MSLRLSAFDKVWTKSGNLRHMTFFSTSLSAPSEVLLCIQTHPAGSFNAQSDPNFQIDCDLLTLNLRFYSSQITGRLPGKLLLYMRTLRPVRRSSYGGAELMVRPCWQRLPSADCQTCNPGLDQYHPEFRGNKPHTAGDLIS